MTDSMKFGPEWLRNLSAESLSNSGLGASNCQTNNGNSLQQHLANAATPPRNMFPEFRYGREEMLSLFDRNCNIPEILPRYKSLFVEKVQYPLAMTPCVEDEIPISAPITNTGRPAWMQRSPVGFSSAMRGISRGGSVDRGRLRGKAIYHSGFQRPVPAFEEDARPIPLKPERSWTERNGEHVPNANVGVEWNGGPSGGITSPRREFPSQARNLENWRRTRNDDMAPANDASTGNDGWRANSFGSSTRWGRSTSWREEDIGNDASAGGGGGGFVTIQRSISTHANDRSYITGGGGGGGGTSNSSIGSKTTTTGNNVTGSSSIKAGQSSGSSSGRGGGGGGGTEWSNKGSSNDFDDNLPEWATENALDVGGTFDATGAFHGISQGLDNHSNQEQENNHQHPHHHPQISEDNEKKESTVAADIYPQIQDSSGLHAENESAAMSRKQLNTSDKLHKDEILPEKNSAGNQKSTNLDITDQMKEVTNNMIEKLISDDEFGINKSSHHQSGGGAGGGGGGFINQSPAISTNMFKQIPEESEMQTAVRQKQQQTAAMYGGGDVLNNQQITMQQQQPAEMPQQQTTTTDLGVAKNVQIPHASHPPPHHMMGGGPIHGSTDLWFYRDPQSKVQGPFSAIEMTEWYRAGYFNENLFVRRVCDIRFRALGELIALCNGNVPFTHSHLLPLDLESITLNNPIVYNNFNMNPAMEKNDQCDELKGIVTAAANSLSHAVKSSSSSSVMNSVDMSEVLNMHFQMLRDEYISHQEMMILAELSKNECFQQMPAHEKEAIVHQKVQMLIMPDYLSSLSGLRNSLAILNPAAGNQLYEAIAQCSKPKSNNHYASGNQSPLSQQLSGASPIHPVSGGMQQQQHLHHNAMKYGPLQFNDLNDSTSDTADGLANKNMLNEYNLRMMLAGGHVNNLSRPPPAHQNSKIQEFMVSGDTLNRGDFSVENQMSTPSDQSPLNHLWMPVANNNTPMQVLTPIAVPNQQRNNQWSDRLLVGITNAHLEAPLDATNSMPQSIWNSVSSNDKLEHTTRQPLDNGPYHTNTSTHNEPLAVTGGSISDEFTTSEDKNQQQQQSPKQKTNAKEKETTNMPEAENMQKSSSTAATATASNRQEKPNINSNKKNKNSAVGGGGGVGSTKAKDDGFRKVEEDRNRRETVEDKRRQKEERKRQQLEEVKREQQLTEDEKRRNFLEEKERQSLIQAQRRKALMVNSASSNLNQGGESVSNAKAAKESQSSSSGRIQTSIAPWSLQTASAISSTGPGLAEIQKAERRERRADQQRQTEISTAKANASVSLESAEQVLKWNASPLQVKSFAEIQAEEAKRLAAEQLEQQRRKEQEQQNLASSSANNIISSGNNINNIWVANKVWSSQNSTSIWEDNTTNNKYNNGNEHSSTSVAPVASNNFNTTQKGSASSSARNLRKSQTVSVMQNTSSKGNTTTTSEKNTNNSKKVQSKNDPEQKKAGTVKKQTNNSTLQTNNTRDEFEKEFVVWCTKFLNSMNTIVDVPTFVTFLQDLESPYEVKDYVRMYLGECKESADFAKQFLERRSKYKNLQRAQNAHNDDMCKPAPALTPSGNDHNENKGKQKKVKKNKMTKLDGRILGFSVTAAEGRINVGDRDYVDAP